jgi:hypothetical protein
MSNSTFKSMCFPILGQLEQRLLFLPQRSLALVPLLELLAVILNRNRCYLQVPLREVVGHLRHWFSLQLGQTYFFLHNMKPYSEVFPIGFVAALVLQLDMQIERDIRAVISVALFVRTLELFLDLTGQSSVLFSIFDLIQFLVLLIQVLSSLHSYLDLLQLLFQVAQLP